MPPALQQVGGLIDIEYVSPLNRAQRAEEGVAIMQTLQAISPLAQIDPSVMMVFDPQAIARELAEINGVPAKVLRSPEDVQAMKDQQAQAAQAQQLLQAAPVISSSVKDLSQAASMAGAGAQQLPNIMPGGA